MTDESRWLQGNRIVNFAWHAFWWMFVYPTLLKHVWTFREATNFWNIPLKKLGDSMTPHRLKVVAYCPWVSLRGPPSLHQFRVRKWHAGCKFQHGWGSRTGTHLKASMGTPFRMKVQRESVFRSADLFHSFAGRLARVVLVEQIYRAQEIRWHREGISRGALKTYAV